jgi:hypothetical protein
MSASDWRIMVKRNVLIDSMYRDIASPEEILMVDRLYARGQKGTAISAQLRKIRQVWPLLVNGYRPVPSRRREAVDGFHHIQL